MPVLANLPCLVALMALGGGPTVFFPTLVPFRARRLRIKKGMRPLLRGMRSTVATLRIQNTCACWARFPCGCVNSLSMMYAQVGRCLTPRRCLSIGASVEGLT